ncbi:response regulator transcription factor [Sideroxydans lithotrophicus]|uniref:Two component transcriptional regulator, winged helix family n=1 Tax=Sideroxydans lithotrophicus (strain ES-1) TaxID=580332 RepID=D5CLB5_SIDLE|nr:response regulator transcription factor [Sideroxydans lithotrophicus]ADE10503.1 two component transcriptional regulator, winged helix family [Sideroxydans lithotrophicus ES-1]
MRVLIIEDNRDLASNMFDFLEAKGHVVDAAGDGISGMHLALVNQYDAIVLDLMLPGMDGITLCRKLREEGGKDTPILMITARDSLEDKIAGLEAGADDYLVKPAELREVELRLRVLFRRGGDHTQKQKKMTVDDLSMDPFTCSVKRGNKSIDLPPIPYKILEILMARSPQVVNREDIEHVVWGEGRPDSDSLRAHVHLLRELIDKPFERKLLRTMRGFGYQLVSPDVPDQ